MKTLLLFIGTVLRSRIIQREGLGAIPAVYKLIRYWWAWTPPLSDPQPVSIEASPEAQASNNLIAKEATV